MKKSFKEGIQAEYTNPAMSFITPPAEHKEDNPALTPIKEAQGGRRDKHTKSIRVNLLFYPEVKEGIEKLAQYDNTSLNDLINKALADYIQERQADINKINELRKDKE